MEFSVPVVLPKQVFRAYDIRGIVKDQLTADVVYAVGLALASLAKEQGEDTFALGRDARESSPILMQAMAKGLMDSGINVIDIGEVPTPVLYFATHHLSTRSGIMITGSHNPAGYNGIKMVLQGKTLSSDMVAHLYDRIIAKNFVEGADQGGYQQKELVADYIGCISDRIQLARPLKIVIDCGNGVAGDIAPTLFEQLGCEVVPLFCEVDGTFPNHHPDPTVPENLVDIIAKVKEVGADCGLAFDGDADRLGIVTEQGDIIWPDQQMLLFSRDLLSREPGSTIVFDVKCTRFLPQIIKEHGGKAVMSRTGHSLLKARMIEESALLAGEMSGHIFFKEDWFGFDDGMYAGARFLEVIAKEARPVSEIFADFPSAVNTPELKLPVTESEKMALMQRIVEQAEFAGAEKITIDGLRVEFTDGWGLVRVSNTTPVLTMRFEADSQGALERIQNVFREQLLLVDKNLALPF